MKWQSAMVDRAPSGSLFVGAGDSFSASSVANHLASMKHLVLDPYELVSNPALATGRHVYFVSVSGRTASNIAASKAVESVASRRIAITANPKGPLAAATDSRILLPYKLVPLVPGTLSFTLSLLTILELTLGRVRVDFGVAATRASGAWRKFSLSDRGVNHFLGNGPSFPICQYAALKTCELLGWAAQATALEEFGHSTLFGLRNGDTVNILSTFDPQGLGSRLSTELSKRGYGSSLIGFPDGRDLGQVFSSIFAVQLAVIRKAESLGLRRPYFANARKKLAVSDAMIYRKTHTA